jgi:hypothetical protein
MTPAMKYRMSLPFAEQFDTRRSEIAVFKDWSSDSFVITAHPKLMRIADKDNKNLFAYFAKAEADAKNKWFEKYGISMPENVEFSWASSCFAGVIPYVGAVKLLSNEIAFVRNSRHIGDFTLDMLWLIVEGIGWRPGVPVSEDDTGWLAVWAEEEECGGYYEIVRAALGMSRPHYVNQRLVMPKVVSQVYVNQGGCN